jgi:hypothetical protein
LLAQQETVNSPTIAVAAAITLMPFLFISFSFPMAATLSRSVPPFFEIKINR